VSIPLFSDNHDSDELVRLDIEPSSSRDDDVNVDHIAQVLERRRAGHPDPYKVALCIEGGGMRGVVSAGMVAALQELDGARLFDHVYGSSAGALNGAYFLAGQAEEGLPIYFEDLPERRFVCWRRYLRGGPLLHLDDLIDEVMSHVRPLDFEALHRSRPTFHALAYDLVDQRTVALPDPHDREELFERLRASSRVPVFGGPPVVRGEHAWCDPLLHEPIPCRTPLALGATHLVVLSTRPTPAFSRAGVVQRSFEGRLLTRWDPRLASSMVSDGTTPYDDTTLLSDLVEAGRAVVISPAGPIVGRLETDPEALRAGAQRGRDAVMASPALTGRHAAPEEAPLAVTVPGEEATSSDLEPAGDEPADLVAAEAGIAPEHAGAPARRPLPRLARDGMAWCRASTRRHSAGASALVRRVPRRRRNAEDAPDAPGAIPEGASYTGLVPEGPADGSFGLRWRWVRPAGDAQTDPERPSTWRTPTVRSQRVRPR
jgi:predicted patatin/cPLA2 family phospholipase